MIPAAALTLPIRLITPATLGFLQIIAGGPSTIMEIAECLELPTERVRLASRLLQRQKAGSPPGNVSVRVAPNGRQAAAGLGVVRVSQTFILHKDDAFRASILANAQRFLTMLPTTQSWEIKIVRHVKARTDKQRKAMFGAAYKAMMEFSGLDGEADKLELHAFMCGEFFGWQTDVFGKRKPVRTTTKNERGERDEINAEVANRFYAFLQWRGAEVGCFVPDPDVFWREKESS